MPDDPLDDYRALNDPARRRQVERRGGYFVVEGLFAIEGLLASPYPVRSVLATERRAERVQALVAGRAPVLVRSDAEVAAIAGFDFHRGVLASADRLPLPDVADVVAGARTVAVVEGLGDHENLGALFRNAAALDVGAVLLDPTTADPLYRRSVRVSLGHVLGVPWTRIPVWPDGLDELRSLGFEIVALTPSPDAEPVDRLGASPADGSPGGSPPGAGPPGDPARRALLLGAEGPGLTAAALAAADRRIRIPLAAGVDSLNVATAAAIAFHVVRAGGH
ncbi:MAG TPA: RNA methyltransferase [Acidimicrobiales bacterium]|nr:RNA methyltransferase [Acidimicrobiales bacterium]